jgi:3-oxoacyl-(acyl-carrier-protein) synthase
MPALSGTKSLSGHSLGAAGVQEAIYSLIMMRDSFMAASAHIFNRDEAFLDLPIIEGDAREAKLQAVMSNSFGFGGTNATLIFQSV